MARLRVRIAFEERDMGSSHTPVGTSRKARRLARVVLGAGALIGLAGLVVAALQLTQGPVAVSVLVDAESMPFHELDWVPEGTQVGLSTSWSNLATGGGEGPLVLAVEEPSSGLRVLRASPALVAAVLALTAAALLARLLLAVADARPFAAANPSRLRGLAVVAVAYAVLPPALDNLAAAVALAQVDPTGASPLGFTILDLPLLPFLLAAALLVMAEVFRDGAAVAADVEGLV